MKRMLLAALAAVAFSLYGAAPAHALPAPQDVNWTYNWSPGAPSVFADSNPGAGVSFTNEPTGSATGDSDIVATNMRVFSTSLAASPDILSANGNYSLTLQLATTAGGPLASGSLTFTGKLSGKFSSESASVANAFGPLATQTLMLGQYNFTVTLIAYTPPGPPSQANAGSIAAHVTVSAITPTQVPEPSTLMLCGLGVSALGGAAWRKRRAARALAAV